MRRQCSRENGSIRFRNLSLQRDRIPRWRVCLEGKVIILVDNSPSAMILPTSILDMIEEANDYYFPTVTGMYLKVSRANHHDSDGVYDTGISVIHDEPVLDPQYV